MDKVTRPLVLDLVEWVAVRPRAYADVMEAWRTSCPRLTVWEDAVEAGLVAVHKDVTGLIVVRPTPQGLEALHAEGRGVPADGGNPQQIAAC